MCVRAFVRARVCVGGVCVCTYARACMRTCVCVCVRACVCVHVCVRVPVRVRARVRACEEEEEEEEICLFNIVCSYTNSAM